MHSKMLVCIYDATLIILQWLEPARFSDSTCSSDQARAARIESRIRVLSDGEGH